MRVLNMIRIPRQLYIQPGIVLWFAICVVVICTVFTIYYALSIRHINAEFYIKKNSNQLFAIIETESETNKKIAVDFLEGTPGQMIQVDRLAMTSEPATISTYKVFNSFFKQQHNINSILKLPYVSIIDDAGEYYSVRVYSKQLRDLSIQFWVPWLLASAAILFTSILFASRPSLVTFLILLNGLGYGLTVYPQSIYGARQLALDADLFLNLIYVNNVGSHLFEFTIASIFVSYPTRINTPTWLGIFLAISFGLLVNRISQFIEWPIHTFALPRLIYFTLGIAIFIYQWTRSKENPIDRARYLWLMISVIVSLSLLMFFYYLPATIDGIDPPKGWIVSVCVALIYIGFSFGIWKVQLFSVDKIWTALVQWIACGSFIIFFDFLIANFLLANRELSLTLSLLICGWLYFPLRQLIMQRFIRGASSKNLDQEQRRFLASLAIAKSDKNIFSASSGYIRSLYSPSNIYVDSCLGEPGLYQSGLELRIKWLNDDQHLYIKGKYHGRRLFSKQDLVEVENTVNLACDLQSMKVKAEEAAQHERNRIMRDLHDDAGADILAVLRNTKEPNSKRLAQRALETIREAIYSLEGRPDQALIDTIRDSRHDTGERLEESDIELFWNIDEREICHAIIDSNYALTLKRIIKETTINTLKHSTATFLKSFIYLEDEQLIIKLICDGVNSFGAKKGKGISNIQRRCSDLGGSASWHYSPEDKSLTSIFCLPLTQR